MCEADFYCGYTLQRKLTVDCYEDDNESLHLLFIWSGVHRQGVQGKTNDEGRGREATRPSWKPSTSGNWWHSFSHRSPMLTEEEHICCRMGSVDGSHGKSRCESYLSCVIATNTVLIKCSSWWLCLTYPKSTGRKDRGQLDQRLSSPHGEKKPFYVGLCNIYDPPAINTSIWWYIFLDPLWSEITVVAERKSHSCVG